LKDLGLTESDLSDDFESNKKCYKAGNGQGFQNGHNGGGAYLVCKPVDTSKPSRPPVCRTKRIIKKEKCTCGDGIKFKFCKKGEICQIRDVADKKIFRCAPPPKRCKPNYFVYDWQCLCGDGKKFKFCKKYAPLKKLQVQAKFLV